MPHRNRKGPIWIRAYVGLPDWMKTLARQTLDGVALRRLEKVEWTQLVQAAAAVSARCLEEVQSLNDWQRRREGVKERLRWMLGLEPPRERTALNARIAGAFEQGNCRIEKIVFESIPGLLVTANFYVPKNAAGPLPCIVYLNGHSTTLDGAKTAHQTPSLWYPANGFALLVVDPLGFGEIPGIHAGTHRLGWWHWLSRGYTPAGVEVWNAMRALDWLETRPEVDASRIGVTGLSGGGVMTQYLAALDDRVAAAAPSCSTYTIGSQAALNLVPRQCDCTFYPNVYQMDFPEVLALIAPRPLLILGGRKDPIFPPAGFQEAYRQTQRIYDLFGKMEADSAASRIGLVESDAGHTDTPGSLKLTHAWMCRWLRDRDDAAPPPKQSGLQLETPERLRCLDTIPARAVNYHVHDTWFPPRASAILNGGEWERRKVELLGILQTRVYGWFPKEEIPFRTRPMRAKGGYAAQFAEMSAYEFDTEPNVPVRVRLLQPRGRMEPVPLVIWIKGPAEHVHFPDVDEFHPLLRSHAVLVLTPRFSARPLTGTEYTRIERTAAVTGRSIAAMRVWDVRRAVEWVIRDRHLSVTDMAVYGRGEAGLAGLYAAVLDSAIGHVVLREPPVSHLAGFALPTILRDTDLPEIAGLLAPRRLSLMSVQPESLARWRTFTGQAGVALSLAEALLGPGSVDPQDPGAAPC